MGRGMTTTAEAEDMFAKGVYQSTRCRHAEAICDYTGALVALGDSMGDDSGVVFEHGFVYGADLCRFNLTEERPPTYMEPHLDAKLIRLCRGNSHYALRDYDAAMEDYDAVLAVDPRSEHALFNKACVCIVNGVYDSGTTVTPGA